VLIDVHPPALPKTCQLLWEAAMAAFGFTRSVAAAAAIASVSLLTGCATITRGTTQMVALDTPGAPGAKCTLTSSAIGKVDIVTPANVTLQKGSDNIAVRCQKQCFSDGVGVIGTSAEAMAAGNLIAGGIIGLGVDAASGAMNKYNEQNQIAMQPLPGCRAVAEEAISAPPKKTR
jgi:hypothetical protein